MAANSGWWLLTILGTVLTQWFLVPMTWEPKVFRAELEPEVFWVASYLHSLLVSPTWRTCGGLGVPPSKFLALGAPRAKRNNGWWWITVEVASVRKRMDGMGWWMRVTFRNYGHDWFLWVQQVQASGKAGFSTSSFSKVFSTSAVELLIFTSFSCSGFCLSHRVPSHVIKLSRSSGIWLFLNS